MLPITSELLLPAFIRKIYKNNLWTEPFIFFYSYVIYAHARVTSSLRSQTSSRARVIFSEFLIKNWTSSAETELLGIVPPASVGERWDRFVREFRKMGLWSYCSWLGNNKCFHKQLPSHTFWLTVWHQQIFPVSNTDKMNYGSRAILSRACCHRWLTALPPSRTGLASHSHRR